MEVRCGIEMLIATVRGWEEGAEHEVELAVVVQVFGEIAMVRRMEVDAAEIGDAVEDGAQLVLAGVHGFRISVAAPVQLELHVLALVRVYGFRILLLVELHIPHSLVTEAGMLVLQPTHSESFVSVAVASGTRQVQPDETIVQANFSILLLLLLQSAAGMSLRVGAAE